MASVNVNSLLNESQSAYASGAAEIEKLFSQMGDISARRAQITSEAANAQELVTSTQALAEAKAQQQALDYATLLGTNPAASTEVISTLLKDKEQLFNQARSDLREVYRKKQTTILDPLQWLKDNLTLDNTINSYNQSAEEYNLVGKRIDDVVSQTGELDRMTAALAQTKTVASAQAEAQVARLQLDSTALALQADALKTNAEGIKNVISLKQGQLDNAFKAQSQAMQAEGLAISRANLALAQESKNLQLEQKKENLAERERTVQAINLYRKSNGMPEISWTDLNLLYKDPEQKRLIDSQIVGGLTIAQTGTRVLATSPAEAMSIVRTSGAQLDSSRQRLLDFASSTTAALSKDPKHADAFKKQDTAIATVNEGVKAAANAQMNKISGSDNIYAPPSLASMLSDPAMGSTAVAKTILKPLQESGVKAFDPNVIMPLIADAISKKQISYNQAVEDIVTIGQKSVLLNNAQYSYSTTMGLPNQTKMPFALKAPGSTEIPTFGALFGGQVGQTNRLGTETMLVNIADPTSVQSYVNRVLGATIATSLKQQAATTGRNGVK